MAVNKALICIILAITLYTEGAVIRKQNLQNDRPIIGILSQELSDILPPSIKGDSYIAASYIKYIESAGARVVPILTNFTSDQVSQMFRSVNGILLPGGGAHIPTSRYFMNVRQVIELAITANSLGDYFPVWGTCLGFESMQHVIDPQIVMNGANAIDIALPLNFTKDAPQSRMFENMSGEMMMTFSRSPVTYNYHKMCISKESFYKSEKLSSFFKVLSVNNDRDGEVFVSTIEGQKYPIYGTQWHPEKNNFEWNPTLQMPHTPVAIRASQSVADFFVNEARKNNHKFASVEEENKNLIYKYNPVTTPGGHFEQIYVF